MAEIGAIARENPAGLCSLGAIHQRDAGWLPPHLIGSLGIITVTTAAPAIADHGDMITLDIIDRATS